MGGCRCTYKNCSLRSDKVTHMFHYPVFDKVRCHQWLTNAQKLEFLDLKVSQLKNRVVCQHHFKDDYFMNFRKDKLKFDAVPTLDGPYCDTSRFPEDISIKHESKHYNIALEDIENEYLTCNEKKENFSVKYADFLTNGDLMDFDLNNQTDNRQLKIDNSHQFNENNTILYDNVDGKIINETLNNNFNLEPKCKNVFTIELTEVPIEIQNNPSISNLNVPIPPITETTNHKTNIKPKDNRERSKSLLKDRKIIILDEQHISDKFPTHLPLKLEPVSPSAILTLPNKKRTGSYLLENANNKNNAPDRIEINNIVILDKEKKLFENVGNLGVNNEIVNVNLDRNNTEQVNISMSQFSNNVINDSNFVTANNVIDTGNVVNDCNVLDNGNVINAGNYINTVSFINVGDVIKTTNVLNTDSISNNNHIVTDNIINRNSVINANSVTNAKKFNTRSAIKNSKKANSILNPSSVLNSNNLLINTKFINKSDVNNMNEDSTRSVASSNKKNNSVKNKIPPERIAAIQEKRKFNMKLRDIIADCLDKLDDNDSNNYTNSKLQTQKKQLSQKVDSYLAKEPELPNMQEYTVAYLEARMNKMEKLLLKKIENNSQRILDLKNSLIPTVNKKSMSTQTILNEEERKKQLFKEISQYLSTGANSLIYEELFIDKFVPKKAKYSPRKKRK